MYLVYNKNKICMLYNKTIYIYTHTIYTLPLSKTQTEIKAKLSKLNFTRKAKYLQ